MRIQRFLGLLVCVPLASCDPSDGLHWSIQGEHSGVFQNILNITCMYAGPNLLHPERYIGIDISPEDHPDVDFISVDVRPMPDELTGTRALRNDPYLGTYWHQDFEVVPGVGEVTYAEPIEMRVEVSLGAEHTDGGVTNREVMIHNLVIPPQMVGVPQSDRTMKLEGRLVDLRLWCVTDKL